MKKSLKTMLMAFALVSNGLVMGAGNSLEAFGTLLMEEAQRLTPIVAERLAPVARELMTPVIRAEMEVAIRDLKIQAQAQIDELKRTFQIDAHRHLDQLAVATRGAMESRVGIERQAHCRLDLFLHQFQADAQSVIRCAEDQIAQAKAANAALADEIRADAARLLRDLRAQVQSRIEGLRFEIDRARNEMQSMIQVAIRDVTAKLQALESAKK